MITQEETTGAARPPRDTWIARATGSIPAPLLFFPTWSTLVRVYFFYLLLRTAADFFFSFLQLPGYLRELSCINVGLNITAMTGKLAEKLPLTMSSLINTIPDSLYPEEDIPTSMNIFTNTESISHYSQMNTGKILVHFFFSRACVVWSKCFKLRCARTGNSCLRARSTCLRSGCCAQRRQILGVNSFQGQV